jgi:hypothetical protein
LGGIVVPQLPIRSVTVDPSDLDSKVAELQMIFGDLSADVLVVALRHNRYDLDQTANDLFDDMRKDMYKRMASSAAEQSSANRKSNTVCFARFCLATSLNKLNLCLRTGYWSWRTWDE